MPWYYAEGAQQNEERGPLDEAAFTALVASGQIRGTTLVWQRGMAEWQTLAMARPDLLRTQFAAATPALSGHCAMCGRQQSPEDLLTFRKRQICANCKPRFAQALTLGLDLSLPAQRYAGFWVRAGARLIDGILIAIVQYALIFAVAGLGSETAVSVGVSGLIYFLVHPTYETWMTVKHRATLGKLAFGLRILRTDGTVLSSRRALGRYFAQLLSQITLCIGYLMAAFDDRKQSLHDRLCDTVVIYEN